MDKKAPTTSDILEKIKGTRTRDTESQDMSDEELYVCAQSDKLDILTDFTVEKFKESHEDREKIHGELEGIKGELASTRESNQRIFDLWGKLEPTLKKINLFMAVKEEQNGNTKSKVQDIVCNEDKLDEKLDNVSIRVGQLESSVQLLIKIMAIVMPIAFTVILAIQGVILYTLFSHLSG